MRAGPQLKVIWLWCYCCMLVTTCDVVRFLKNLARYCAIHVLFTIFILFSWEAADPHHPPLKSAFRPQIRVSRTICMRVLASS